MLKSLRGLYDRFTEIFRKKYRFDKAIFLSLQPQRRQSTTALPLPRRDNHGKNLQSILVNVRHLKKPLDLNI